MSFNIRCTEKPAYLQYIYNGLNYMNNNNAYIACYRYTVAYNKSIDISK